MMWFRLLQNLNINEHDIYNTHAPTARLQTEASHLLYFILSFCLFLFHHMELTVKFQFDLGFSVR